MPISVYCEQVHDLIHRPGEYRERTREIAVPEQLGAGLVVVAEGEHMVLNTQLESLHDGILVSVRAQTTARGECGRCLSDVSQHVEVEFREVFAYSVDEAFDYVIHDELVDLEAPLRDAVVLSLPFQPVCQPDCHGLDPRTGERLTERPVAQPEEDIDPRWAALRGLSVEPDGHASPDRGADA